MINTHYTFERMRGGEPSVIWRPFMLDPWYLVCRKNMIIMLGLPDRTISRAGHTEISTILFTWSRLWCTGMIGRAYASQVRNQINL